MVGVGVPDPDDLESFRAGLEVGGEEVGRIQIVPVASALAVQILRARGAQDFGPAPRRAAHEQTAGLLRVAARDPAFQLAADVGGEYEHRIAGLERPFLAQARSDAKPAQGPTFLSSW